MRQTSLRPDRAIQALLAPKMGTYQVGRDQNVIHGQERPSAE